MVRNAGACSLKYSWKSFISYIIRNINELFKPICRNLRNRMHKPMIKNFLKLGIGYVFWKVSRPVLSPKLDSWFEHASPVSFSLCIRMYEEMIWRCSIQRYMMHSLGAQECWNCTHATLRYANCIHHILCRFISLPIICEWRQIWKRIICALK
jgi:hypothetical protein